MTSLKQREDEFEARVLPRSFTRKLGDMLNDFQWSWVEYSKYRSPKYVWCHFLLISAEYSSVE